MEIDGENLPYEKVNKKYEFVPLLDLLHDKTSYNDYYFDEEEIITDILKDQVQGISLEKGIPITQASWEIKERLTAVI